MAEVRLTGKPLEQRVADRLKSSGEGTNPAHVMKHGDGPTRTITHVHLKGNIHGTPSGRGEREDER